MRISNGATFSIPLKQTRFATENASNQSHTFEFQFKVRNVQDYSNIIHNVTRYKGNTDDRYDTYPSWVDNDAYEAFTTKNYLDWSEGFEYDNYDAFLQWYLPEYSKRNPDAGWPPSYDDIEYRKTDKILSTSYAAGRYYDGTHGICIGAQDALFTNGVDTVNVAYVEDKLINLSIVYSHGDGTNGGNNKLMSIYLNGILTGVARSTIDGVWSIGEDDTMNIVFNSQYCDFDLYKIRVYNQSLTLPTILTNYTVDLKDPVAYDLTQLAVVNNSIGESQLVYNNMITYNNNHPDGYIMPYIIFTTKPAEDNVLPYSKATPINDVQVEFVNTGLERAYTTGELGELAEKADQSVEEYYKHHCPSFIADHVAMSVQGTSSEFYPRRNYKAKTKNAAPGSSTKEVQMYMNRGPFAQKYVDKDPDTHLDFFYMDNNTVGTTKFTLKIDFMESSGTYNMGFANLVYNAYTHHPLYDYNKAGAFQKAETEYQEATSFDASKTYWYKNHKGNWKNTVEDELKITTAAEFAMGPVAYAASIGQSKVSSDTTDPYYNKWYLATTVYVDTEIENLTDYRTSVQGFPVLAFHQTTDANGNSTDIRFIGRYNMLLDKGSDEAYGFKPIDEIYQKFVQKKGKPVKVSKVAECWEAENNSRGFCSFRDASTNRTDDKFFDTGKLTTAGAPIVADYWEYRYHDKADALDVLYDLKNLVTDADSIAEVQDAFGVDISDPTVIESPDSSYQDTYTQGIKNGGDALLDAYSNWEKAVRWVWSTDQDSVPSAGSYVKVDLGLEVYAANTYYIADGASSYVLDSRATYDPQETYYKLVDGGYTTIKLCASADLIYVPNTFYVDSGLGDYVLDPDNTFNGGIEYYKLSGDESESGAEKLPAPVEYNGHIYNYDTKEYRNAKFTNDLDKHFNLEYLVTYFIMTEVFECYDSRGKNMMMASWGPQKAGGDYIWYPIFYDIDTQLGINNTGIPSFEYYVDATEDGTFSTNDSVLFNNLYRNFKSAIIQKYRQLRGVKSSYDDLVHAPLKTIDRIEKWYLGDPETSGSIVMRGERPLIALNLDEYYKYITITNPKMGYQDRYGGTGYDNGTYFYALQGDRSLSRQQFLTNRLNYIDSWLNQGNYERGGTNIIRGRIAANSPSNTSDKWIEGTNSNTEPTLITNVPYWTDNTETVKTHMFDGEYWLHMEPVRNSYVTVGTDAANFPSLKYTNTEGPVKFVTPDLENGVRTSGGYHEQLYYIYGLDQMKSLGDMSKLYWTEFNIEGKATKMTELLLGYDGIDENNDHYENSRINMYGIHASNSASDNGGMPLLKKVNLSYITFNDTAPTYNFASCEKLEDFRAVGSNITNVTFANGVALKTLYLPETIKALNLTEATKLNNIVTEFRVRDDRNEVDVKPGLYIPGLTDAVTPEAAQSNIGTLSLIGDCLGYDSYKLLKNYYYARSGASASYIAMTDVDWSPYKQIDEGTEYNSADNANHLYWVDDGHYGFVEYTFTTLDAWNLAIKNGELYKLDNTIDASQINSLDLLDSLKNASNFYSTASTDNSIPIITGIVYVDNSTAINETVIESQYVSAYPELKIFFKKVNKTPAAKYVVLNNDGTYDVLARRSLGVGETFFPNPRDLISSSELDKYDTRSGYDFYGWSYEALSPDAVENLNDDTWYESSKNHLIVTTNNPNSAALTEDKWYDKWSEQEIVEGQTDYTFYAAFGVHKYKMTYMDGDDTVLIVVPVPSGDSIVANTPNSLPTLAIEDTAENLYKIKKFVGWSLLKGGTVAEWIDSNIGRSSRDRIFYPVFEDANVHDAATDEKYFQITNDGTLSPKEGAVLKGKITIPTRVNNIVVKSITGFNNQPVTHVFFMEDSACEAVRGTDINNGCFANNFTLKHFETPSNLKYIYNYAFYCCAALETTDWTNNKLMSIGEYAFAGGSSIGTFNAPNGPITLLFPGSVTTLGTRAFSNLNRSLPLTGMVFGSEEDLSILSVIGSNVFRQNSAREGGTADRMKITVYCDSSRVNASQLENDLRNAKYNETIEVEVLPR